MPNKGGTYTIVVDNDGDVVSATYNGELMINRPEGVIGRHPKEYGDNMRLDLDLPDELSSCICLAQFIKPKGVEDPACRIIWGDLV